MTAVHDVHSTNGGDDPESPDSIDAPDIVDKLERLGARIEGLQSTVTTGAFAEDRVEILEDLD